MIKKNHIGIFQSFSDLVSYLDDRLIFIGNMDKNTCVQIIHDNDTTELKTKEFLNSNNYSLNEKADFLLEILFSNSDSKQRNFDAFFVNTKYNTENISSIIKKLDSKEIDFAQRSFHFLNSNSYFEYYYQWGNKKNAETIGNPLEPCKMVNDKTKPF